MPLCRRIVLSRQHLRFIRHWRSLLEPPLPDSEHRLLRNENGHKSSLPAEFYGHEHNRKSFRRWICANNSYSIVSSYIYLPRVCCCGNHTTFCLITSLQMFCSPEAHILDLCCPLWWVSAMFAAPVDKLFLTVNLSFVDIIFIFLSKEPNKAEKLFFLHFHEMSLLKSNY